MSLRIRTLPVLFSSILVACSGASSRSDTATLYRNSAFDPTMRVHWASFDADESDPAYNSNNCGMAARLLNANVAASAKADGKERDASVGFWCELGPYREKGSVPSQFYESFPADVAY
ncbi:hypothetical protein ACFSTI_29335 [Rhizorhabdus histidinilytica]|uniref:hypothetical protein n=1 Tax=Rhizorhabdus histidinilytica TaxID=439228 RepID=UPI00111786D4|nr:hypothetical protein [Rhizorhabdus histidinilytica]